MWVGIYSTVALAFTSVGVALPRAAAARRFVERTAGLPGNMGSCRIPGNLNLVDTARRAVFLFAAEFPAVPATRLVTGPWGMSFLLLLFPAALAIGLHLRRAAPKQALRIVGAGLGVVVLVLIFGAVRLVSAVSGQRVRVGLIASD